MSFTELEYKYRADNVQLSDFSKLMEKLGYRKRLDVSSWDHYYTKTNISDKFQRFRQGDAPELTKKIKTKDANNWIRIEVDLPLDHNRVNEKIVTKFVGIDGYQKNFKIYKTCFIFWQENINYVFYIVYDENMKEQGRFIEVEVNKEKVEQLTVSNLLEQVIKDGELVLKELGITAQNRMKKSLFEIFRKP